MRIVKAKGVEPKAASKKMQQSWMALRAGSLLHKGVADQLTEGLLSMRCRA